MKPLSMQMAEFAHTLNYGQIPADVRWEAKRFLLDSIGCALAAEQNEDMQAMLRFTQALGGTPEATVIGSGLHTNAANAALMNGLLIRALDYNDIFWEQDPSHPSDLLGVVLGAAEANGKTGIDVITAIVLAYEFEMRWCMAAFPGIREVGWHHASLTQFVSPLVAGKLYDLAIDQLIAAIGISGSSHFTLGGVVAGHLTNMKNTADPLAAQAGLLACLLAREGVSGPAEIIEGKEGLFEVLNSVRWEPQALVADLGNEFMITKCSYKAFPSEALTHQPISAALKLCQEHAIEHSNIESILVETTSRGADILSDPSKYHPESKETADHSLPYVIAAAVVFGNVLPEAFSADALQNQNLRALLPKIKVVANPEIDALFPAVKRAIVSIRTREGQVHRTQTDFAKGSPQNPLRDEDLASKFTANAKAVLPEARIKEIIETTLSLEDVVDIGQYMQLLTY